MTVERRDERGQMILLAAVAIAVALVPMLLAYVQLGYHPDVAEPEADHTSSVERTLERSLVAAADGVPANYSWGDRDAAVTTVRSRLGSTLTSLNRSALERGTALQVSFNATLANASASRTCPSGTGRQFGPCEGDRGVVVQERASETHVLAAAFDVRVVTRDGERRLWTVVKRR